MISCRLKISSYDKHISILSSLLYYDLKFYLSMDLENLQPVHF